MSDIFERLEDAAIPRAARAIGGLGAFHPFAVVVSDDDRLEQLVIEPDAPDEDASEVYQRLVRALAAAVADGRLQAVALVVNELAPPELEIAEDTVIHAFIDTATRGAMSVYVPYAENDDGELSVGRVVRQPRGHYFFSDGG